MPVIAMVKHILLLFTLLLAVCNTAFAVDNLDAKPDNHNDELLDMSLEGLLEIPVVVTASRHKYNINKSSVPVSIITAEDIHYSGLTSIADILRYAPGMDVLPNRRGFSIAAVRGFHDNLSERTLVLINGRPVNNPYSGAADFFRFPIGTEDIERIEILRGPGGAAWGANAFTGVINIITKEPLYVPEVTYTLNFNEHTDTYHNLQYNFGNDKVRNRFSLKYHDMVSSLEAGYGEMMFRDPGLYTLLNPDDYDDKDFFRQYAFNYESIYNIAPDTKLDLGLSYSNLDAGILEFIGVTSDVDFNSKTFFSYAKLNKTIDSETSAYIQFRYDFFKMINLSAASYKAHDFDIEAQYSFTHNDNHQTQVGSNVHLLNMQLDFEGETQTKFQEEQFNQYQIGLFGIDRWEINNDWTVETQLRGDYFTENENELGLRLTALRFLDDDQTRALRFSAGRSYRTPMIFLRGSSQGAIPLAPGLYFTNLVQAKELRNENILFFEAGYQQSVIKNTMLNINAYYQQMDDMIGLQTLPDPLGLGRRFTQFFNQGPFGAYGAEADLEHRFKNSKLTLWYAYNDIQNKFSNQDFRSYAPSKNKAGLTWRYFLNDLWTFNTNYQYSDMTMSFSDIPNIRPNHRLDLTLSRKFNNNKGEFMIGVQDIINYDNNAHLGFGQFTANTTPGRTIFARLQLKF